MFLLKGSCTPINCTAILFLTEVRSHYREMINGGSCLYKSQCKHTILHLLFSLLHPSLRMAFPCVTQQCNHGRSCHQHIVRWWRWNSGPRSPVWAPSAQAAAERTRWITLGLDRERLFCCSDSHLWWMAWMIAHGNLSKFSHSDSWRLWQLLWKTGILSLEIHFWSKHWRKYHTSIAAVGSSSGS